ncbi:hypothetical protein SDRG_02547 [Saprolegnia diclina VS20]|uniref:ATP-dependent DNA helicase n=1 Tax=Saprolegnia diclina (strain VS20) TaxID=1156394 RepID=T0R0Q5_SAPDV|nr:hypothetical protein SDRG_02547 [Saprolegnia diclina VS20]EQC39890.1 hypothetical protein SDRG_02547 [Saprolegnia diclina VS20]|eukprot:XP_008606364.1 hypothetical protein SDRG_02547 [Saprolegnia diclina VS20]
MRLLARWDTERFPWSAMAQRLLPLLAANDAATFKPLQQAAVNLAQRGFSLFLNLPTGAGKSLCFQLPALLPAANRVTVIVSPLRSLLQDQQATLARLQLSDRACFLSPGNVPHALSAETRFLYTTPEMVLTNPKANALLLQLLHEDRLSRVVVDEAHCIVEWGSTFRPAYMDFARLYRTHLPQIPLTFLTATASDELIEATARIFHVAPISLPALDAPPSPTSMVLLQHLTDRTNLTLHVVPKPSPPPLLALDILRRVRHEPSIVYVLSQKDAEAVAKSLVAVGARAQPYHAGMSDAARKSVQYQWMSGKISIICATVAFGMGIDRSDVRHVVHHALPLSLASYMQQIGRAGRDGAPAVCTLYYDPRDASRAAYIASGDGFVDASTSHGLRDVVEFIEERGCRRQVLYAHFGHSLDDACCENCNCGVSIDLPTDANESSERRVHRSSDAARQDANDLERLYHTLQQTLQRRPNYRKANVLSRKTIQSLLELQPESADDLQLVRGLNVAQKAFVVEHLHMFQAPRGRA